MKLLSEQGMIEMVVRSVDEVLEQVVNMLEEIHENRAAIHVAALRKLMPEAIETKLKAL